MPYCPNCGAQVAAGDRFCPSCGGGIGSPPAGGGPPAATPISAQPVAAAPPPPPLAPGVASVAATKPGGSTMRKVFMVGGGCLGALIVGVALIVGAALLFTDDAAEAARDHLEMIKAGQVEPAYQNTSPAFRESTPLEQYRELVESRAILKEITDIGFPEREVENGVATLKARVKEAGGLAFDVPIRLRKEGEHWKMIAIDWSEVPVGAPVPGGEGAAIPRAEVVAPPAEPVPMGEPSVGTVVIGAGREDDGSLIRPGKSVSKDARRLSADIELIDHPAGGRVRVWVEKQGANARTEPIECSVQGQGRGNLTFNLNLGDDGIPPGEYRLVVLLGEERRFETPFKVK